MSSPVSPILQRLQNLRGSSPDFHDQLRNVLCGEEYQRSVPNLQRDDLIWLASYLDNALDGLDLSSATSRECLRELGKIYGIHGNLIAPYDLSPDLQNTGSYPFASGGYGDLYQVSLNGRGVRVKRMRVCSGDNRREATKAFCQEAAIWKRLKHPNVLPLLGITTEPLQLVSDWMPNGDLPEYIKKNPSAHRPGLLCNVAEGLCYLHSCSVIHGDLKGSNVLVDNFGNPYITDFGIATVAQHLDSMRQASCQFRYSAQWAAPEVLNEGAYSKETDVFSFAMVMTEVFTDSVPFSGRKTAAAMFDIMSGKRLPRQTHPALTVELWTLMKRCWNQDPRSRPEISEVLKVLCVAAIPEDVRRIMDQVHKHCNKISVAKEEASQLMDICNSLNKHLRDPQQPNYGNIKTSLAGVEERLGVWSKYNLPKSLMNKADIESGVAECAKRLASVIPQSPAIQSAPTPFPSGRGVNSSDRARSFEAGSQKEEPGEGFTMVVAGVDLNKVRFNEQSLRRPEEQEKRENQPVETDGVGPVKRLDGEVVRLGEVAFAAGTYCEVWVGRRENSETESGAEKVALKTLRALKSPASERARKNLESKLPKWAGLRHGNILPFYGIVTDLGPRLYMVSPWQENGNLLVYVKKNPAADKIRLLRGSADGLTYLHQSDLVHGNVKCKNVLVSDEGEPLVCDFAIAEIVEDIGDNSRSKTVTSREEIRFAAPELIEDTNAFPTKESDTFSFAMLMLECITEEAPYSNLSRDAHIMHARTVKKQMPSRPDGKDPRNRVSDGLWDLILRCWSINPEERPKMGDVHNFFLNYV